MQLIIELAPLLLLLAVAFSCGYGVREYIARRRNAAARKKFYEVSDNPLSVNSFAPDGALSNSTNTAVRALRRASDI